MAVSVFDLFKVGIGPSSSHTVGPMRAARLFATALAHEGLLSSTTAIEVRLLGSLGATGRGHGSDSAVVLGLMGQQPETVEVDQVDGWLAPWRAGHGGVTVMGLQQVMLTVRMLGRQRLPFHTNGMVFSAADALGQTVLERTYFSVGGGFVVSDALLEDGRSVRQVVPDASVLPWPFHSAAELLALCRQHHCHMADVMRFNERHWRDDAKTSEGLRHLWSVMQACVRRGLSRPEGSLLPGKLGVPRRAPSLFATLNATPQTGAGPHPWAAMDWLNLYALAVNEENASAGRVVTAPTNGAAGIIPAVLHHWRDLRRDLSPPTFDREVENFLLTAGAVGLLYKENASISGAEVGCQGEVGVACSMAAAGLCAVMGGTPEQVENAAEIGMEHHLGLTCDPVGGLVQIPCIERNAVAAVQAVNAARLALHGNGSHRVSLDKVIETMRQTGLDMKDKYKETSRGGLAVNVVAC